MVGTDAGRRGTTRRSLRITAVAAAVFAMPLAQTQAQAFPESSGRHGAFLEAATSMRSGSATDVGTVGFTWTFAGTHMFWGGAVTPYASPYLSGWRAPDQRNIKQSYTQLGIHVGLRFRFAEGQSPWFTDVSTGASVLDGDYETQDRHFSTAFQFVESVSLGRNFGADGAHELSVGLQHFSNGGIKKPNPGENFVRLRYQYWF